MALSNVKSSGNQDLDHYQQRIDLAACFRWAARSNWHEGIANHFSLAVSDDGSRFLMNPVGRHFSRIRASELQLLDANDPDVMNRSDAPDPTAWCIHGAMHRQVPQARCVLHVHSKHATVLASLKDSSMPPIDQNTMRFYTRIAIDDHYGGMGLGDEAERLPRALEGKSILLMGNHGVMVMGETPAEALDELYHFERACETLITAYSTGRELRVVSHEVAHKTMLQWRDYWNAWDLHFNAIKEILDEEEPSYRE